MTTSEVRPAGAGSAGKSRFAAVLAAVDANPGLRARLRRALWDQHDTDVLYALMSVGFRPRSWEPGQPFDGGMPRLSAHELAWRDTVCLYATVTSTRSTAAHAPDGPRLGVAMATAVAVSGADPAGNRVRGLINAAVRQASSREDVLRGVRPVLAFISAAGVSMDYYRLMFDLRNLYLDRDTGRVRSSWALPNIRAVSAQETAGGADQPS